jgi:hypothetical protein
LQLCIGGLSRMHRFPCEYVQQPNYVWKAQKARAIALQQMMLFTIHGHCHWGPLSLAEVMRLAQSVT